MQATNAYPLVPVANFLSAFLVLIPLPWLLQHWNTGAWTHAIWLSLLCIIIGVNTTLWPDNVDIKAVVWCDITVRVVHAASLAIIATNFVMARRLCLIMHLKGPMSETQKKKAKLFDLFVCIGIPIISVGLSWFLQGHRFTIFEGIGCMFAYYGTPIYVALYEVWLVIFAVLSAIYGCFIIRALIRRHNALRSVTQVDPDISLAQLRRVIALGCTECIITLPCTIYVFILNIGQGLVPWKGLGDAHSDFSRIWQFPAAVYTKKLNIIIHWNEWVGVFSVVVFFIFFGFSKAMWSDYYKALAKFSGRLGIKLPERIRRSRPSKDQASLVPTMVFKVRTILGSSMTQSHATGTLQVTDLDTRGQPESSAIHASSVVEIGNLDLEKGILVTEVPSTGSPQEKVYKETAFDESVEIVGPRRLKTESNKSFSSVEPS